MNGDWFVSSAPALPGVLRRIRVVLRCLAAAHACACARRSIVVRLVSSVGMRAMCIGVVAWCITCGIVWVSGTLGVGCESGVVMGVEYVIVYIVLAIIGFYVGYVIIKNAVKNGINESKLFVKSASVDPEQPAHKG